MAIKVHIGDSIITTYVVVLGQQGDDPLGLSGDVGLALSRSLRSFIAVVDTSAGHVVEWVGWPGDLAPPTTTTTTTTTTTVPSSTTTIAQAG